MTGRPHDGCGENVAAYALGALEPAEAEAFRRHLETCSLCPHELSAFESVVEDIAAGAPRFAAPTALRRRVMQAVAAEPRSDPAAQPAASPRRDRRRALARFTVPRPALGFGLAGSLAVVVAAIVILVSGGSTATSTRTIAADVAGHGTASLRLSGGHTELVVNNLPAPGSGQIYEVWLQRGSTTSPTSALFGVPRDGGAVDVDVPGSLKGVTKVMVTVEPAGGTKVPTHKPVITADLT